MRYVFWALLCIIMGSFLHAAEEPYLFSEPSFSSADWEADETFEDEVLPPAAAVLEVGNRVRYRPDQASKNLAAAARRPNTTLDRRGWAQVRARQYKITAGVGFLQRNQFFAGELLPGATLQAQMKDDLRPLHFGAHAENKNFALALGHYRLGFWDSWKKPLDGVHPDFSATLDPRFELWAEKRQALPLRGAAAHIKTAMVDVCLYGSNVKIPAAFLTSRSDDAGGVAVATRTVENLVRVESLGARALWKFSPQWRLGAFAQTLQADLTLPNQDQILSRGKLWGVEPSGEWRDFLWSAIIARGDSLPVAGSDPREALFWRGNLSFAPNRDFRFELESFDARAPLWNPSGKIFSAPALAWTQFEFSQTWRELYGLKFFVKRSQNVVHSSRFTGHFLRLHLSRDWPNLMRAEVIYRLQNPRRITFSQSQDVDGVLRSVKISPWNAQGSELVLSTQKEKFSQAFAYALNQLRSETDGSERIEQKWRYKLAWSFLPQWVAAWSFSSADLDLAHPSNETLRSVLDCAWMRKPDQKISLRWNNAYRDRTQGFINDDGFWQEFSNPGSENTFTLSWVWSF